MLELRPVCECCAKALPPDAADAFICSFECTFCAACVRGVLAGACPNCGGELTHRPRRPPEHLARHPASTVRKVNATGCAPGQASVAGRRA